MWSRPRACLPFMFHAVTTDGAPSWDRAHISNPALCPLIDGSRCAGIAPVQINPLVRRGPPCSARAILNRANEIIFDTSLPQDLTTIELIHRLVMAGKLASRKYRDMHIHVIEANDAMAPLSPSSNHTTGCESLILLRDSGRHTAGNWIDRYFDSISGRGTVDLASNFRGSSAEAPT